MEVYKINHSSRSLWILLYVVSLIAGMIVVSYIPKSLFDLSSPITFLIVLTPFILFAFISPHYLAKAKVELSIDEHGINIKWHKQIPLDNNPDRLITWEEIKDYNFESDLMFETFTLNLKQGPWLIIVHNNSDNEKDDYLKFRNYFETALESVNNNIPSGHLIKTSKTIYETKLGLAMGIVILIIIIGLSVNLISSNKEIKNLPILIMIYLGSLFYLSQIFQYRFKNKK